MNNYNKNISIIKAYNEEMEKKITGSKIPAFIVFKKSRNKQDNFLYKKGPVSYAAYSMHNPSKEIKDLLKSQIFHKDTGSILIGMGMGHYLYELCKRKEAKHKIVAVEPYPYFIKKSFENYDFSKWFKDGTLMIVGKAVDLDYSLGALDVVSVIQGWNIICSNYAYHLPREYGEIIEHANGIVNQLNCNIGTVMGAGAQIAENDILNLPYIIRHRGVKELKDLYKGCPAVVVSTGPSLEKNIFHLKKMGSRVIIIAVAQALRVLLAYEIKPDFICTVDYGKVNEDHFKGLYDSDVPLIALNRTYAPILKKWKGTKFIVSSQPENEKISDTVTGIITEKGCLMQGGSVSHMAFGLADYLGCNPIIMIGQDLSYPSGKSHIPLADASGDILEENGNLMWDIKDPHSSLGLHKYAMSNIVQVHGYYGGLVRTNRGLASFITTYERIISGLKNEKTIINATEGGCKLRGATQYTLIDAINRYAKFNINKKRIKGFSGLLHNADDIIKKTIPLIEKEIDLMKEIGKNTKKGLKTIKDIRDEHKKKKPDKNKIEQLLKDNKEYSFKAQKDSEKLPLLALSIYAESRIIHNRELHVKGKLKHLLKSKDDLVIRLRRNEIILEAAKRASTRLISLYIQTKRILERYLDGEDVLISKEKYLPDISTSMQMFSTGNWGRPLLEARMILKDEKNNELVKKAYNVESFALEMRQQSIEKNEEENKENSKLIEYSRLTDKARKLGGQREFESALNLLKRAVELYPNKEDALWGYATCLFQYNRISQSLKEYKKLIKIDPDNLRYRFEYGQVMLAENVGDGMKIISKVMAETDEYDSFFVRIGDIYYEKGMWDRAVVAYENYLAKFPPDIQCLTNLSKCYKSMGKDKLIKKLIKKYKEWFVKDEVKYHNSDRISFKKEKKE